MNKLDQNTKNSLNFLWLIIAITCVGITYYCMKVRATNNYKEILQVAAENCSLEVVKFLIKNNIVDVNDTNISGLTVLGCASGAGCFKVVKFLVDEGVNINITSKYGSTALHNAAHKGSLEVIQFLLERGANPNIINSDGKTPRSIAVLRSRHNKDNKPYEEIISLLYNAEKEHE